MDSVKEILVSFLDSLRERFGNPLVGAYLIAWLIWNFRLVLVLIGDGEGGWGAKLAYIDNRLMVGAWDWINHGFLIPLLVACTWVFAFPFVARKILVFDRSQRIATKRAVLTAEEKNPIPDEEATRLRLRIKSRSDAWEEERKLYLKTIEDLEDKLGGGAPGSSTDVNPQAVETARPFHPNSDLMSPASPNFSVELDSSVDHPDRSVVRNEDDDPVGLRFAGKNAKHKHDFNYVDFMGRKIVWPWTIQSNAMTQLPGSLASVLKSAVISEESLVVLYSVRDQSSFEISSLSKMLDLERFEVQVATDELASLGLIHGPHGAGQEFSITSNGRMFLAWLLRKGFRFSTMADPF